MADAPGFVGHLVGFYFESGVMLIIFLFVLYMYRLYRISQNKLAFVLVFAALFFLIAEIFSWLAKIILYINGPLSLNDPLQLITRVKLGTISLIIGNYFYLIFYKELFIENPDKTFKSKLLRRKIIEGTLVIVLYIPVFLTQSETIALAGDALGFLILLIDTLFYIPYSIRSRKKMRNEESLTSLYINLTFFGVFIFNVTIMLLLDRISLMTGFLGTIEGKYSIFYYGFYISAIIGVFFSIRAFKIKNEDEGTIDPQDFLSFFKKPDKITIEEVTYLREQKLCLVCKGKIGDTKYLCDCGALYCTKCTFALIQIENICWACENALDKTKPVKMAEWVEDNIAHILPEEEEPEQKKKINKS